MALVKILLPLDGSEFSRRVIPHVRRLFNPKDYQLILLRVGDEPHGMTLTPPLPIIVSGSVMSNVALTMAHEPAARQIYASQLWETSLTALANQLRKEA